MSRPNWLPRFLFRTYKATLSPLLHALSPSQCRYLPTCSEYAYVAVARHGVVAGLALALGRLARCHPFAAGGLDPVPESPVFERRTATTPGSAGNPGGGASKPQHLS